MGRLSRPAPCGAWRSPISAAAAARAGVRFSGLQVEGRRLRWVESRPDEGGRSALVGMTLGGPLEELLPSGWSARTTAVTYGGRGHCGVSGDGAGDRLWFSRFAPSERGDRFDQRLFCARGVEAPEPLTPSRPWRFAEPCLDALRERLICIWEDWEQLGAEGQPRLSLAAVPLGGGPPERLFGGRDLITSPTLSPDGRQLAWLAWDYPGMPWDSAELWLADLDAEGPLRAPRRVAGSHTESCGQPRFSPEGRLFFLSDRGGAWRLHALEGRCVVELPGPPGELGVPQWRLGPSTWAFASERELVCAASLEGQWSLHRVSLDSGEVEALRTGCTWISEVQASEAGVFFVGASPARPPAVMQLSEGGLRALRDPGREAVEAWAGYISLPEALRFPSVGGEAHAFYYPPTNKDYEVPEGERPPLIVLSHGGPTSATTLALSPSIQHFTSRGFAVVDVNYRGSTGYGRAYRLALYGRWGELDVDDCVWAARHLIAAGLVDEDRVVARGGSAGGYTTLALAAFRDILAAGVSYYGISDLLRLSTGTDNLELRYPEVLVGPLPEAHARYVARSPRFHADQVCCPLLFFQGADDPAVLPEQTRLMVEALREREVPAVERVFEGEGHGFRRAETLIACLETELAFYGAALGFTPDGVEPLDLLAEGLP